MTGKSDFTDEEWEQLLEGPPADGLLVITADRGGSVREPFSMAKAYTEARQRHGESELLDEIAAAKPEVDHTRALSPDEAKANSIQHLQNEIALLKDKATPEEVE